MFYIVPLCFRAIFLYLCANLGNSYFEIITKNKLYDEKITIQRGALLCCVRSHKL